MEKIAKISKIACMILMVMSAVPAIAGDESSDALKAMQVKNRELEARLSKIETMNAQTSLSDSQREETRKLVSEMLQDASSQSAMPKWMEGLKFSAFLRLRYQYNNFRRKANANPARWNPWAAPGVNSGSGGMPSDHGMNYKLTFGFVKKWDEYEVGFQLASAAAGSPTAGTQLGDTFAFGYDPVAIDLAYAKWTPKFLKGFSLTGGKMNNPFYSSDIIWDGDIRPEGLWAEYEYDGFLNGSIRPFVGAGLFIMRDFGGVTPSAPGAATGMGGLVPAFPGTNNCDAVLFAYDMGVNYDITEDLAYTFAFTYYDWTHYEEAVPGFSGGATASNPWVSSMANGISGNMGPNLQFGVIDIVNKIDWKLPFAFGGFEKLPMSVLFEWAHNCKDGYAGPFDAAYDNFGGAAANPWIVGNPSDPNSSFKNHWFNQNNAYQFILTVGENEKKGDWSMQYKWIWVEANATIGTVSDGDFMGTNRKGHVLNAHYNVEDYLTIGANLIMTQPIHSPRQFMNPPGSMWSEKGDGVDTTLQLEAIWNF